MPKRPRTPRAYERPHTLCEQSGEHCLPDNWGVSGPYATCPGCGRPKTRIVARRLVEHCRLDCHGIGPIPWGNTVGGSNAESPTRGRIR